MRARWSLWLLMTMLAVATEGAADEVKVAVATNFVGAMSALVERSRRRAVTRFS